MVPMKKLTVREAWIVGIGLDARLTTEIIVAQLLFNARLIDVRLFTALGRHRAVRFIILREGWKVDFPVHGESLLKI